MRDERRRCRRRSSWHDADGRSCATRLAAAGTANPDGVRFLLSAHASHEELFLFRRLTEELIGDDGAIDRGHAGGHAESRSRPDTKFKVPPVDAPNVNGARAVRAGARRRRGEAGRSRLVGAARPPSQRGRVVGALRLRPGSRGLARRHVRGLSRRAHAGTLPLLVVQGVLLTDLARAADFVLPGASFVEKEASYTNDQGRLQGAARAIPAPGRGDGGLADSRQPRRRAGRAVRLRERRARPRRHRRAIRRRRRVRRARRRWRSRGRCRRATGCRRRIRPSAGSGISCSRICRRSKGAVDCRRCRCRRRDSAARSEIDASTSRPQVRRLFARRRLVVLASSRCGAGSHAQRRPQAELDAARRDRQRPRRHDGPVALAGAPARGLPHSTRTSRAIRC